MSRYAISVGSNLGDRLASLRTAYLALEGLGETVGVSGLYETAPLGGPTQDAFLNAVIVLDTELQPEELLDRCQSIEAAAGRIRGERWGPRTLDVDLVTFDGEWEDTGRLQLPHPRATEREFVARPLAEVWPDAPLGGGVTAAEALDALEPQGVELVWGQWIIAESAGVWLLVAQLALIGTTGAGIAADGSLELAARPLETLSGSVLLAIGLALGLASGRALGPGLTAYPEPKREGRLIETGPYRVIRHPMYTGVVLVVGGASLLAGSRFGMVGSLILLAFFVAKAGYEERRLRVRYPGYADYRRRVRHRFIPGVL